MAVNPTFLLCCHGVEEQRLNWTRNNQDTLCVELYHNLCDAVTQRDTSAVGLELPSPTDDPDGYKVVTNYMLHGPCGKDARNATCASDGKCSKYFPNPFLAKTFLDQEGYPHYRRRDNKVTVKKGKFTYDNKHVVPHNHYMLIKYKAHINVKWCNRSKDIKYLFNYLNKGPDRATIVIEENVKNGTTMATEKVMEVDEIKNYLNCRFLSPCEAVWRLFSFDIHYSYPTIMHLSFQFPNQNTITLQDFERLPALGVEGFEQLMMVNKRLCATLKEACFANGLLNDDKEWTHALSEASLWALGPQLGTYSLQCCCSVT
nr:helicase [Tanacetum cinerariifolium]